MGAYTSRPQNTLQDVWRDEWQKAYRRLVEKLKLAEDEASSEGSDSWPPLLHAVRQGRVADVEADVHNAGYATRSGLTVFHIASLGEARVPNSHEVLRLLFAGGARQQHRDCVVPIHLAAARGDAGVLRVYAEHRAISPSGGGGFMSDVTPLHIACMYGHDALVPLLLDDVGLSPDVVDSRGFTPLHLAIHFGHDACVRTLIQRGANVNAPSAKGDTPLHIASYEDRRGLVEALLARNGIEVDAKDKELHTPLHHACRRGNLAVAEALLRATKSADSYSVNCYRDSPLHSACYGGQVEVVRFLVSLGVTRNLGAENVFGETPLHAACTNGSVDLVRYLVTLSGGVDVNKRGGRDGHTPLHSACWNGHFAVVLVLLESGADPLIKTLDGAPPVKWAYDKGFDDIVEVLQRHVMRTGTGTNGVYATTSSSSPGLTSPPAQAEVEAYVIPSPLGRIRSVTREKAEILQLRSTLRRALQLDIGDIDFQEIVGTGSFGKVYRGLLGDQVVAVKRLRTGSMRARSDIELFCREVAILSQLENMNVIKFVGACITEPSRFCIVTEFVSGGSLHKILHVEKRALDPQAKLTITLGVARGMYYLHTLPNPVIHRDLNSHNILIDGQTLVPKVADFGESRILRAATSEEDMTKQPGNLRWMAPEVFVQGSKYTTRADIFSYALCVWELYSGCLPFEHLKPALAAAEMAYHNRRPPITPSLPRAIALLIRLAWQQDPTRRPDFGEIVQWLESNASNAHNHHAPTAGSLQVNGSYASVAGLSSPFAAFESRLSGMDVISTSADDSSLQLGHMTDGARGDMIGRLRCNSSGYVRTSGAPFMPTPLNVTNGTSVYQGLGSNTKSFTPPPESTTGPRNQTAGNPTWM